MPLPDFFVIGAPKAGTTALHVALARHPRLFMSRVKEPKHFLTDGAAPDGRWPRRREDLPRVRLAPRPTTSGSSTRSGGHAARRVDAVLPARPRRPAAHRRGGPGGPHDRVAARPGRPGPLQLDPSLVGRPRAGGRLPAGLRPGGPPGGARLGAVLAVPGARPLRRAAAAAVRGGAARAGAAAALPGPARGAGADPRHDLRLPRRRDRCGDRDPGRERHHPCHRQHPQPGDRRRPASGLAGRSRPAPTGLDAGRRVAVPAPPARAEPAAAAEPRAPRRACCRGWPRTSGCSSR